MRIDGIPDFFDINKLNQGKKTTAKLHKNRKVKQDKSKFLRNPKKVQGQEFVPENVKSQLSKIPEIRQTKIADIKGQLAGKYYDQNHIIKKIAGKMSSSPELISALANQNKESAQTSAGDLKKLIILFNRMDRKFYSSIEILDEIAKKIILDINNKS